MWVNRGYAQTLLATRVSTGHQREGVFWTPYEYKILYHDCSDLSHVLVFTITWQEKKPGDIMV